jgi:hypothetical protein
MSYNIKIDNWKDSRNRRITQFLSYPHWMVTPFFFFGTATFKLFWAGIDNDNIGRCRIVSSISVLTAWIVAK